MNNDLEIEYNSDFNDQRLNELYINKNTFTEEDFSKYLWHSYTTSYFPLNVIDKNKLREMFYLLNKEHVMNKEDWFLFNSLPNEVIVFRGVINHEHIENYIKGFSWTLNKHLAITLPYIKSPKHEIKLITGLINKKDIFFVIKAYADEIVLDYEKIRIINQEIVPFSKVKKSLRIIRKEVEQNKI